MWRWMVASCGREVEFLLELLIAIFSDLKKGPRKMRASAQQHIAQLFAKHNFLDFSVMPEKVKSSVAYATAPFLLWSECLPKSGVADAANPIDGILITMATRIYGTVSGMLSLLAMGKPEEAEVLSRTVMESSFSLLYAIEKNTEERLLQFLEIHLKTERNQNANWEKSLKDLPDELVTEHKERILHKNNMLDVMENFLRDFFSKQVGLQFPSKKGYPPNVAAIFEALNRSVEYRTVYMAMCSQAHHDAEDIFNELMAGTLLSQENYENVERERHNFGIYLVCMSLYYFVECMEKIGQRYKFNSVVEQSQKSAEAISELASEFGAKKMLGSTDAWLPVRR